MILYGTQREMALSPLKKLLDELFPNVSCFVAGGAIRDLITVNSPEDYDVFFLNGADVKAELDRLLVFYSDELSGVADHGETPHAYWIETPMGRIDLVKETVESPQACIASFDVSICQAAYTRTGILWKGEYFESDLAEKKLRPVGFTTPLTTLRRAFKYAEKGYRLGCCDYLQLASAVRGMDADTFDEIGRGMLACAGNPS